MARRRGTGLIIVAMVAVVGLVGARLWANAERNAMPLLWQVSQSADGRLFILLGNRLHIESPHGESLGVVDLGEFGVRAFQGGFAVLPDDTIILPLGQLPPVTLRENLQVTAAVADETNTPSEPLQRCSLATMRCERLTGDGVYRAGRAYRFAVDDANQRIVVADTARHRLLLLDYDGRILDRIDDGFVFPNQVEFTAPGEVTIAATHNDRLTTVAVGADGFAGIVRHTPVDCWPGSLFRRHPSGFVQAADGAWWSVVAMRDMSNAGLYRLRAGADCAEQVELPPNADPFFLLTTPTSVLVPDAAAYRIHQFALDGAPLADFGSPELVAQLQTVAGAKARLTAVFDWSLWALLLVAAPMLLTGAKLHQKEQVDKAAPAAAHADGGLAPAATAAPPTDVAPLVQRITRPHEFSRRWSALDTESSFVLFMTVGLLGYAMFAYDVWRVVTSRSEGLATYVLNNNTYLAAITVIAAVLVARMLILRYERITIDRSGIHYTSFLNGPFAFLNRLHPDWTIRWDRMAAARLKIAGNGGNAGQWFYEFSDRDGGSRSLRAFFWRAAGSADGGLHLRKLRLNDAAMCADGLRETKLFAVLEPIAVLPSAETAPSDAPAAGTDGAPYPKEYYEAFVGPRFDRYWRVWSRQQFRFPAPGFNFPAFLVAPIWAGYRKAYPIVLAIAVAGGLYWTLLARFGAWLPFDADMQTIVFGLAYALAVAFIADSLYLYGVHQAIRQVTAKTPDHAARIDALRKRGGTSVVHTVAGTLLAGMALRGSEELFRMLIPEIGP